MATKRDAHPANVNTILCETCRKNICQDCCTHEMHTKIPLKDVQKAFFDLVSEQKFVINDIKSLERKAKTSVDSVKNAVEDAGVNMLTKLKDVRQSEVDTTKLIQEIEKGSDLIEVKYLKAKDLKTSKSEYGQCRHLEFIQSQYNMTSIPTVIGRLEWVALNQEIAELCSFKSSKSSFIKTIWPVDASKAWILHYKDKAIHLIDYNGQIIETRNFEERIEDFCLSKTGDVLYTTWGGCELKKLTEDNQRISLYQFNGFHITRGLCLKGEDAIVCLCSTNGRIPNRLAKMSIADKTAKELKWNAQTDFSDPGRVSCTVNGITAIVDWSETGRFLKVVGIHGKCLRTWNGEMENDSKIVPFQPYDVSFCNIYDEKRFLVTLNHSTCNKVCSLDVNGGDARCIYTGEKDSCNGAIATYCDGHIWIGDQKGSIHIMTALKVK